MTSELSGRYFPAGASRFHAAKLRTEIDGSFAVLTDDITERERGAFPAVGISSRLGNLPRRLSLPSGALFECDDNDAVDRLLSKRRPKDRSGYISRLESSWRLAIAAIVMTVIAGAGFAFFGVPYTADFLAQRTPREVDDIFGREALRTLDGVFLQPSALSEAEQAQIQAIFARAAREGARGEDGYRLLVRSSPIIGPNALALPDGTIILTDELWALREHDDEVLGVLMHETAHVDRRHSLQSLYQAAIVPAVIALVTGDPTQIAQMATILPGILMQSAYSRGLEQEADDDAAVILQRIGSDPAHLADMLERLQREVCGEEECAPSWIGTHPETASRAARLRGATQAP